MVKIERGKTIFDSTAQTLVNTINCVGVMGKGLALEFKNRYPKMYDKYKSFCDKGIFKPGVLWIYKAEDGKWILNFPTKIDWKNPSELSYIKEGLKKFVEIWEEKEITSIAFPLLGCKNGGLDPEDVIPLMEKYLNKCEGLDVTIYDDREPEVEEPETDSTKEFFEDENPKEIVIESAPLTEEEPPKPTDEIEEKVESVKEVDETPYATPQQVTSMIEKAQEPLPKYSEEQEILNEIVAERRAMNEAVDKILEDFQKGDNSPEYRKKVAKQIVHVVNRRGFPSDSVFQI